MTGLKKMSLFTKIASVVFLLACAMLPGRMNAQGSAVWGQALSSTGKPAAYATVRICPYTGGGIPCSPLSNVYSDLALSSPVSNPYTADASGNFSVFVTAGAAYIVQLGVGSGVTYSYLITAAGLGTGSVTMVGLAMPSIFTVTNSPVTGSGTLTAALNTQIAGTIFAGPCSGSAAQPTFRSLCASDLPTGVGTVSSFSSGNLSPIFTTSVATATTTPALTFSLSNAGAYTVLGNSSGAAGPPAYTSISKLMLPFTYTGSTSEVATASGSFTSGNCLTTDSLHDVVDSGGPCGTAGAVLLFPTGSQAITQTTGTAFSVEGGAENLFAANTDALYTSDSTMSLILSQAAGIAMTNTSTTHPLLSIEAQNSSVTGNLLLAGDIFDAASSTGLFNLSDSGICSPGGGCSVNLDVSGISGGLKHIVVPNASGTLALTGSTVASITADSPISASVSVGAVTLSITGCSITVTFSATPTFSLSPSCVQTLTLTGAVSGSTITSTVAGATYGFAFLEDSVGGRPFVWPTNVKTTVPINEAANGHTICYFTALADGNLYPNGACTWY